MERLLLVLENEGVKIPEPNLYDIYFCTMGQEARKKAFALVNELRALGFRADMDHTGRSLKAQFKYADKCAAPYVAVIGEDELNAGVVKLRDMQSSAEQTIEFSQIKNCIKQEKANG